MNKSKKILLALLLSPFVLFFILAVALYVPPVQRWAVRSVASYMSANTPWKVSVGSVRLVFPLDLGVGDMHVAKVNDSIPNRVDTIACVGDAVISVRLLPLFRSIVVVNDLDLRSMSINTLNIISSAQIKGRVGHLNIKSRGINLSSETVDISSAFLGEAHLTVLLNDTVPEDTSKTKNNWAISLQKLNVKNSSADIHMPGDTLQIKAVLGGAVAEKGYFDLGKNNYSLSRLSLLNSVVAYNNRFAAKVKGLDPNHLYLSDAKLAIDSLLYRNMALSLCLRDLAFKERSGLVVSKSIGHLSLDTLRLSVPQLALSTPYSNIKAKLTMDLNAFADTMPGKIDAEVTGSIGKHDIKTLLAATPIDVINKMPNTPIAFACFFKGNMNSAEVPAFMLSQPSAFRISAKGQIHHLLDMDRLRANLTFDAATYNLSFLRSMLPSGVALPNGMRLNGRVNADGPRYTALLNLREGRGVVAMKGSVNVKTLAYNAAVTANNVDLSHFLPGHGLHAFSGRFSASGRGTDVFSTHTSLTADAGVTQFHFAGHDFAGLNAQVKVAGGHAWAELSNNSGMINGSIKLDGQLLQRKWRANVQCELVDADFMKLGITRRPFNVALRSNLLLASDFNNYYMLQGSLSDICLRDSAKAYRPENIVADMFTHTDSTHANVVCGDFMLHLDAHGGYKRLLRHSDQIVGEVKRQIENKYIDQLKLRSYLPQMCVRLNMGHDNVFTRMMQRKGFDLASAFIDMDTSPIDGINGVVKLDSLIANGVQLDTIRVNLKSDSLRTDFTGQIRNNRHNPQYVFNALFGGTFYERGLYFGTRVLDAKERVGVALGLKASMESNGVMLSVGGRQDPILGYKKFSVNKNNYVLFSDDQRISADIKLRADDGTSVQVYSNDSTEALQDLTLGISNFELSKVMSVLPYLPNVSGVMNGDFHVIKTANEQSVSSAVIVDNMVYEGCKLGNLGSEFVYMPLEDGKHVVDGTLSCNGYDVGAISGSYDPVGEGSIDATFSLTRTPLKLLNGFIPNQIIGLKGYCDGDLTMKGTLSAPHVDGTLKLDSAYLESVPYGVELKFADTPVTITDSRMLFDNFKMFAKNRTPLTVNGSLNFANLDNIRLNTRISAQNYLLIDSKENMRSEAYGKAYVNFLGVVRGPLESLEMRGKLDVLGSTDMTYILRDSPLTTDTQLDNLVKFTSFKSKRVAEVERPALTGFSMDLTMDIDEGAHIVCALNADHSNYVDLMGGGTLRMQYGAVDGLRLTGRYTLNNGEMKYSLPVIPLKTFAIQDGSYVEFMGDAMNPRLNITATEETKASVSTDGGAGRSVTFNCGVKITKTLKDMGLEFIIEAPEDMSVNSDLQAMSKESRGKVAVTMLTTGMYLTDGNINTFSMNSALSAFLNSQINSISGNALRTLDLSFGMDNSTGSDGEIHTDYSFKFSKRFWNNRLRIVVGGKVSSGATVPNQNDSFFDNVTFEYRLSQNSNKYLKFFYDRDSYDWLEGYVEQFGAGFMYRRKLQNLTDLFRFKRSKNTLFDAPETPKDSLK